MQKYFQTTWRLWVLLKPFHRLLYLQLFLIVCIQLLNVLSTVLLAQSINKIVEKQFDIAAYLVVTYTLITFFKTQVTYFKEKDSIKKITFSIQQYLQEYSLKKVLHLNVSQYLEDHSAIKLQVITRGEDAIQNIISTIFLSLFPTLTQIIFSVLAIGWYSLPVALVTTFVLVVMLLWSNRFTTFHRPYVKKNIELWDEQRKTRVESFQHLNIIKTFGVEDEYIVKYLKGREEIIEHSVLTRNLQNAHSTRRWGMFSVGNMISRLVLVYQAYLGKILVGDIYAVWSWISDANNNLFNVIQAMRQILLNFVELEKYLNIIDKKPEFDEGGVKNFENGDIIFENVNFKYPKSNTLVIKNLNIKIPNGKKVAFVGFSGSGKSTIIKLLLRIYDWTSGDIKIAGKSLREIDAKTLRQKIGYVEQHVDLFDASVKENILFGVLNLKESDEKILEVAHKARIDQFFDRLGEKGLETIIGERGVKLSGGERQRIGIARALIKDPDILIFDEATASLDTENEKYIQEAIDESSKGRTTIIVAHRLSTIQNSDIIFVMEKGEIVGVGKHEDLLQNCKEYQRLVYVQNDN